MHARETEIVRLAVVSAAAISALVLSVAAGTPSAEDLPSISLAWPVLFHVERAVAVVSLVAAAALVGWRASRGELPSRIGQLEWRIAENAKWADDLRERVWLLEVVNGVRTRPALEDDEGGG